MAKKQAYAPIKTGVDPRTSASEEAKAHWLKVEPNSQVDVAILVEAEEIISAEQCAIWMDDGNSPVWIYTGPDDPYHELKADRRYRAFLPVLLIADDGSTETKVWSMGKQAHRQLLDIADASGALKGMEVRIKRTGNGLKTRYSIVPKGKRRNVSKVEEVDVISLIGPLTSEEARQHIAEKLGAASYEKVLESLHGKAAKPANKKRAEDEEVAEEEDDLGDLELA